MSAITIVIAVLSGSLLLCLSLLGILGYYGFIVSPTTSRRLVLQLEGRAAESEIDRLTRATLQQMRDTVRADFRGRTPHTTGRGSTVLDGEIVDDGFNDPTTQS